MLLSQFAEALRFGLFNMGWIFVVLWGLEQLVPRGSRPNAKEMVRALRYWVIYAVAGAAFATAFAAIVLRLGVRPAVALDLRQQLGWSAYIIGPLVGAILYDFCNYWMHRAQHRWFWRQHSVHHSIENLSGINSYFHWTEDLFRLAFIAVPTTLLLDIEAGGASVAGTMLVKAYGNYLHSPTRLHLGPMSRLFADNRWHRIHHSIEPCHFDRNFGTFVTWWDHLFGTAHVPARGEWPATGVPGLAEPDTLAAFILLRPNETSEAPSGLSSSTCPR